MNNTALFVAIKSSVILYFAACTGIDKYSVAVSATPHLTNGTWKVNRYVELQNDQTTVFDGYTLKFEPTGKVIATRGSEAVTGNWAEDEIANTLTISLKTNDETLKKLSNNWAIADITGSGLSFQNADNPAVSRLKITGL